MVSIIFINIKFAISDGPQKLIKLKILRTDTYNSKVVIKRSPIYTIVKVEKILIDRRNILYNMLIVLELL